MTKDYDLKDPYHLIEYMINQSNWGDYVSLKAYSGHAIVTPKTDLYYNKVKSIDDLLIDVGKKLHGLKKIDYFFTCPKTFFRKLSSPQNKHGFYKLRERDKYLHLQNYRINKGNLTFTIYLQDELGDSSVGRDILLFENSFNSSSDVLVKNILNELKKLP